MELVREAVIVKVHHSDSLQKEDWVQMRLVAEMETGILMVHH